VAHCLYAELNRVSQDTILWLERMLPGAQRLEAYQLLGRPMPTIAQGIYGFHEGTRFQTLPERMDAAHKFVKQTGGCLVFLALVCLFLPPVFLLPGALLIACVVVSRKRARARERVRAIFDSLWSVDTWLERPQDPVFSPNRSVGTNPQQGPPSLPHEADGGKSEARTTPSTLTIILLVCGLCVVLLFALSSLDVSTGPTDRASSPGKRLGDPETAVATDSTGSVKPTPEVRLAIPMRDSIAPSPPQAEASSTPSPIALSYSVVGVTDGDTLNVRSGPGVSNHIIARLPNGTTHIGVIGTSVMNRTTEWVPIQVGGRTGWVTKQHLQRE
jgi:hypothetical protein